MDPNNPVDGVLCIAHLPLDSAGVAAAPAMLGAIADEARAFWGDATPYTASVDVDTARLPSALTCPVSTAAPASGWTCTSLSRGHPRSRGRSEMTLPLPPPKG